METFARAAAVVIPCLAFVLLRLSLTAPRRKQQTAMAEREAVAILRFTMHEAHLRLTNVAASHCATHHAQKVGDHTGEYETCPHAICRYTRETLTMLATDVSLPEPPSETSARSLSLRQYIGLLFVRRDE